VSNHDRKHDRADADEAAREDMGSSGPGSADAAGGRGARDDPLTRSSLDYGAEDRPGDDSRGPDVAENRDGHRAERG
jgi:hypothetical protein